MRMWVKLSLVHREREEPIFEHIFARQQQTGVPNDVRLTLNDSSCNLSTPACNASGLQTFHPKLCEASSVVVLPLMKPHKVWGETFGDQKRYRLCAEIA